MYQRKYGYLSPMEVWKEYKTTGKHPEYNVTKSSFLCGYVTLILGVNNTKV